MPDNVIPPDSIVDAKIASNEAVPENLICTMTFPHNHLAVDKELDNSDPAMQVHFAQRNTCTIKSQRTDNAKPSYLLFLNLYSIIYLYNNEHKIIIVLNRIIQ